MTVDQAVKALSVTEKAASKIKQYAQEIGMEEFGLRMSVKPAGCFGLLYDITLESKPRPRDIIIENDGFSIFVTQRSLAYLNGTTLDISVLPQGNTSCAARWRGKHARDPRSLNEKGFVYRNPNARITGGCSACFSIITNPTA